MRLIISCIIACIIISCNKKDAENSLTYYLNQNNDLSQAELIACAASLSPIISDLTYPTDVFFYPVDGATDFKYFECENLDDSLDYSKYFEKKLPEAPVFNGYLRKFKNTPFEGERMGIVTYLAGNNLHICDPIRLKTNEKPTEYNASLMTITSEGITPTFNWEDGQITENVIYFQVVSDTLNNLISGTYTFEKTFQFYNLSNVVLNITKGTPELEPNSKYKVLLMAVSEDNWVNLISERPFTTD